MTQWNRVSVLVGVCTVGIAVACGGDKSPSSPSAAPSGAVHLTAPVGDSPTTDQQLDTLRPTLTVKNGTTDQPNGPRMYEFQVSDSSTFSASSTAITRAGFAVVVSKTGVPESANGKTSFQVDRYQQISRGHPISRRPGLPAQRDHLPRPLRRRHLLQVRARHRHAFPIRRLGAPTGRSGAESASVPGAVYRNVWLADHPRPASLGSALAAPR